MTAPKSANVRAAAAAIAGDVDEAVMKRHVAALAASHPHLSALLATIDDLVEFGHPSHPEPIDEHDPALIRLAVLLHLVEHASDAAAEAVAEAKRNGASWDVVAQYAGCDRATAKRRYRRVRPRLACDDDHAPASELPDVQKRPAAPPS